MTRFEVFTANTSWESMALVPSRHLTGVWGAPALPIARLGTAIRNACAGPSVLGSVAKRSRRPLGTVLFVYSVTDQHRWELTGTISQELDGSIRCEPDAHSGLLNRPKAMGLDPMMFLDGWSNGYVSVTHRRRH
jgi:hypothetical protein